MTIAATGVVAIVASLCGCKGRTMENMEPTGDTVEVIINGPEAADTAAEAAEPHHEI